MSEETNKNLQQAGKLTLNRDKIFRILKKMHIIDNKFVEDLVNYIESGENETSLLSIFNAANGGHIYTYEIIELLVGALNNQWQPLAYVRLSKICALWLAPLPNNNNSFLGSNASPDWWRYCVTFANSTSNTNACYGPKTRKDGYEVTADRLFELAQLGGATKAHILDVVLTKGNYSDQQNHIESFSGIEKWFHDERLEIAAIAPHLSTEYLTQLCLAIQQLSLSNEYLDVLVDASLNKAKSARSSAVNALIGVDKNALKTRLRTIYSNQTPASRALLVSTAVTLLGDEASDLLNEWAKAEDNAKTKEAIEQQLAFLNIDTTDQQNLTDDASRYIALDGTIVTIPPCEYESEEKLFELGTIDEIFYDNFAKAIDNYNAHVAAIKSGEKKTHSHLRAKEAKPLDREKTVNQLRQLMSGNKTKTNLVAEVLALIDSKDFDTSGIAQFIGNPALSLYQISLLAQADDMIAHRHLMYYFNRQGSVYQAMFNKINALGDWRAFDHLWMIKFNQSPVIFHFLEQSYYKTPFRDFLQNYASNAGKDAFWPLIMDSISLLDEAFGLAPKRSQKPFEMDFAFMLLAILPKIPKRFATPLMVMATGNTVNNSTMNKAIVQQARNFLNDLPNLDPAIANLLLDGQQSTRIGAANWLKNRNAKAEIPALKAALKKEKNDVARAALLSALDALGEDISSHFAPETLLKDAQKGLEKNKVKGIDWFPFDQLPKAIWKNGAAVDPMILQWWITLAAKLKQPQGNAMISLWLDQLAPESANQFGLFVAKTWVAHDTHAVGDDEANAHAAAHIAQRLQQNQHYAARNPQYAQYYITDKDLLFQHLRREVLGNYLQSAVDAKGILALAARVNGADIAAIGSQFIKKHGKRASQAKAIIDMLAANPEPAALQVVLAAANRTKQRSVQEHARQAIDQIAEKFGWTLDELADRTIPSAGLDENGEAELECGRGRIYTLKLNDDSNLIILNDSGKEVKALPAANPQDTQESEELASAKKFIANAKKELKQVIALQTERLFEAMCLERIWPVADWQDYLFNHPLMRRIVSSLIWIGLDKVGNQKLLFRPMEDGSLTDSDDNTVTLEGVFEIKLAHVQLISDEEATAWRNHIKDYEIKPVFQQLRQDLPQITDDLKAENEIIDRKGWMIETFKLRAAAKKFGYVRGETEDSGSFFNYSRRYAGADLIAYINFTGSYVPEENIAAALTELRFGRDRGGNYNYGGEIRLQDVPPVLLAETIADYHAIAAAGTGFIENWEDQAAL
ncbi:DUF4132 domain-containing protein [Bartonella sp. HY761]|uniref:DUF4132 domain-containing protein n=1 Tax=Bartonella sp. HY761 TaxID=2979330 RepID=UPI002205ACFE|nr:DUF4132 domain-containing protein [Bartonella sp. HY761]UXN06202.1 DUF4132 domain-containing protein [Bartonella sp. HY761]